jgi:hypothetical protein
MNLNFRAGDRLMLVDTERNHYGNIITIDHRIYGSVYVHILWDHLPYDIAYHWPSSYIWDNTSRLCKARLK